MVKYLIAAIFTITLFTPISNAKEISILDGIIKIRTHDTSQRRYNNEGHYEVRNGRLIWVEKKHKIINSDDWVLLTRIHHNRFDWVVVPAQKVHRIKKYIRKGFHRSMTGRKKSCYMLGKKKERLWKKHHMYWN